MKRFLQLLAASLALALVFSTVDLGWEWTSVESSSEGNSYCRYAAGFRQGAFVWGDYEVHGIEAPRLILAAHAPLLQPAYFSGGFWDGWAIGSSVLLVIPTVMLLAWAAWHVLRVIPGEVARDWRKTRRKLQPAT